MVSPTEVQNTEQEHFYHRDDEFYLGHMENKAWGMTRRWRPAASERVWIWKKYPAFAKELNSLVIKWSVKYIVSSSRESMLLMMSTEWRRALWEIWHRRHRSDWQTGEPRGYNAMGEKGNRGFRKEEIGMRERSPGPRVMESSCKICTENCSLDLTTRSVLFTKVKAMFCW